MEKLFAIRLRELRIERKISQQKVAVAIGTTQSQFNKIEHGYIETNFDILIKLANYFHVTTDYLLGIDHEPLQVLEQPNYTPKQQEAIKTILLLKNDSDLDKIIERAKTLKELE